jgi:hypothetical protein
MQLIRIHPELGAVKFLQQTTNHQIAIEAAVSYVEAGFARALPGHANDAWSSELAHIERKWVIETIYQGAYLRQYHLWEKGCKEYFTSMGLTMSRQTHVRPDGVKDILSSRFALTVPNDVMDALCTMLTKVNNMKHERGVQEDEFVSAEDYTVAVVAVERFWEFLVENEQIESSKGAR